MKTQTAEARPFDTPAGVVDLAPVGAVPTLVKDEPARPQAAPTPNVSSALGALSYRHSDTFGNLAMALAQAQGEFGPIEKKLSATVTSRRDGARGYTYNYADLAAVFAAVRPALSTHGLAVMQMPSVRRGAVVVTTMLAHGSSGEWFANDLAVAVENLDPQAVGSATTYAKRYGLTALVGVAAEEDDDGQKAGVKKADVPDGPDGFDTWWARLQATARARGFEALEAAWDDPTTSPGEFKNHLTRYHADDWKALKDEAQKVGRK